MSRGVVSCQLGCYKRIQGAGMGLLPRYKSQEPQIGLIDEYTFMESTQ